MDAQAEQTSCELLRYYRMLAELRMLNDSFIASTKDIAIQFGEIGRASELAGHKISKMFIDAPDISEFQDAINSLGLLSGISDLTKGIRVKNTHRGKHICQQHNNAIRYHGRR